MRTRIKYYMSIVVALFAITASSAEATVFAVTKTADDGSTNTLRWAITQANGSGGTINITVKGPFNLASPLPHLSNNIIVNGLAPASTIQPDPNGSTAQNEPLLNVDQGATVTLNALKLTNGHNRAIYNAGTLTLSKCILTQNSVDKDGTPPAGAGGAAFNAGSLTIKSCTISNNTASGDPRLTGNAFSGDPAASGGAIYSAYNSPLSIESSTISGNVAQAADGVSGTFLSRILRKGGFQNGSETLQDAENYYRLVDPPIGAKPGYSPDPSATPSGTALKGSSRSTLGDWWTQNKFTATGGDNGGSSAAYLNNNDLGFGRDMHIRATAKNPDGSPKYVAGYVSNYSLRPQGPDQNPLSADFAKAKDPTRARGTVCMEYSPIEGQADQTSVVKFYVYNGLDANAPLVTQADLDGNGAKFVPQLCMVCHGGSVPSPFPSPANTQMIAANPSYFREFDISTFKFPRPGKRVDDTARASPSSSENLAFHKLNNLVLATKQSVGITDLINGWYSNSSLPPDVQDTTYTPEGWKHDANGVPYPPPSPPSLSVPELYTQVVGKSCRTCHIAQTPYTANGIAYDYSFLSYDEVTTPEGDHLLGFARNRGIIASDVLSSQPRQMPHSKVTFSNFWRADRQRDLAQFTGPNWTTIGYDSTHVTGAAQGGQASGGGYITLTSSSTSASTVAFNTAVAGVGTGVGSTTPVGGTATGGFYSSVISSTRGAIANDLIADNFAFGPDFSPSDTGGFLQSFGHNLTGIGAQASVFGNSGTDGPSTDIKNIVDPKIGGLTNNGGTMPTHALLSGSRAIDKGSSMDPVGGTRTVDQRGFYRPFDYLSIASAPGGDGSDIGAFELGRFEAENLTTQSSPANLAVTFSDSKMSGGKGSILNATAPNQSISYVVFVAKAATYRVKVGVKYQNNKGIFQLAVNGVNKGTAKDEYSATTAYVPVLDLGTVSFSSAGNYTFQFTVTGRNALSNGYAIDVDYIELTP